MIVLRRSLVLIGLSLLCSAGLFAAEGKFGFHNKTNKPVELGFGTQSNEPSQPYKQVKANESINDQFNRDDLPVIVVKTSTGEEFFYHFKVDPKSNKNIQLKWTTELIGKKTELLPQVMPGNISKSDIQLVKVLDADGNELALASDKSDKKAPEASEDSGDVASDSEESADDEPAKGPKKGKVSPYDVLGINERLSKGESLQAKVLGLKFPSTIKDAQLSQSEAKTTFESNKIKKARAEIDQAFEQRKAVWDQEDGVSDEARKALEKKKVTGESEQAALAKATFQLIEKTYEAVKKDYENESSDEEEP